ncbi:ABC transporter substrate-binding protein [Bordetella genomosp. 10]|uniref:ABC transporter substrate-binding protein n=1 Tax=Bordetella genomosp. 10 TaxID=1416804 RepID=A0A261S4N0_9BORD|nr:tripartite tricarboxylate transporter substrate binding protein [Bordetella genomosp. 10]OZI31947.1 ABC transporter substrate-binding protein [Bordetella genomosp. 10]
MTSRVRPSIGKRLRGFCLGLASLCILAAGGPAKADWPDRPIVLIVPFPAGSSPDLLARLVSEPLSQTLGQPIIVENKPGAGGNIGTRMAAQAKPDGYTLLFTINGPLTTAPTLYKKTLGYDPFTDLAPVTLVATSPNVLAVPGDLNVKDLKQFVDMTRERPGALNYGTVGPGSASQLAMEMFKSQAGLDLVHIPYAGFPQVIGAIIGGDIQAAFMVPAIAMPQTRDGRVKVLAVTSLQRSPVLPDVPTMAEQGYPDFEAISWDAVLVPAGTPSVIIERLNSELARIIDSDKVRQQMAMQYFTPAPSSPAELTTRMRDEKARWDKIIEKLNLSLD